AIAAVPGGAAGARRLALSRMGGMPGVLAAAGAAAARAVPHEPAQLAMAGAARPARAGGLCRPDDPVWLLRGAPGLSRPALPLPADRATDAARAEACHRAAARPARRRAGAYAARAGRTARPFRHRGPWPHDTGAHLETGAASDTAPRSEAAAG